MLASGQRKGEWKLGDSQVAATIFNAGKGAAERIQAFLKAGGDNASLVSDLKDYAAFDLRRAAEDADGTLNPAKAEKWLKSHSEALSAFPETAAAFRSAAAARTTMDEVAARHLADRQAFEKSAAAKFLGDAEPTMMIGRILKSDTADATMRQLGAMTAKDPAAREGLRKAVADYMLQELRSNSLAGDTAERAFKSDTFQTFIRRAAPALRHIMEPEEIEGLQNVAADLQQANRSIVGTKLPGGSNTAQDLAAGDKHGGGKPSVVGTLVAMEAAGEAMHHATGNIGRLAGMVAVPVFNAMRANGLAKVDDLVTQAMLHPDLARALIAKVPPGSFAKPVWENAARQITALGANATMRRAGPVVGAAAGNVGDYIQQQRQQSIKMGLLDPNTGLPTKAGLADAARQYANAIMMGTTAPGETPGIGAIGGKRPSLTISKAPLGTDPLERNLSVNDILDPATPSLPARSRGVQDIARQLMDRGSSALKALGVRSGRIEGPAPLTDELLSRTIASEVKAAMQRGGKTASDWYTGKIRQAMAAVSTVHPEVATEPNARMGFTSSLAITSQGETVPSNVRLADQAYSYFKENGRFPTNVVAKNGPAMNANFDKLNNLIDTMGLDGMRDFLSRDFTVKDLKGMGYDIGGENVGTQVKGSAILGPKIGGGFYQNLNGNFDPVTMDLWFMRGWGRLTGTLVGMAPEALAKQRVRLEDALTAAGQRVPKTVPALMKAAEDIIGSHERDYVTNRAAYDSGAKAKSELTYAAERFEKGQAGINEQPGSGSARTWMRSVVGRARELLAAEGTHVTPADLQAIWWYPEKDLYGKLGGRDSEGVNVDYASAISDLARKKGVSDADLARAVGSVDHGP